MTRVILHFLCRTPVEFNVDSWEVWAGRPALGRDLLMYALKSFVLPEDRAEVYILRDSDGTQVNLDERLFFVRGVFRVDYKPRYQLAGEMIAKDMGITVEELRKRIDEAGRRFNEENKLR